VLKVAAGTAIAAGTCRGGHPVRDGPEAGRVVRPRETNRMSVDRRTRDRWSPRTGQAQRPAARP
jgi:hypothetical protein